MISNSRINGSHETSQSTERNYGAKRGREDVAGYQKFKGVVPQQNGHWGAQIYANHQRIWLGTFKSERDAAMAYDSATIKLRSGESHRNFAWNNQTVQEPLFQSQYSMETIMIMIRNGTYPSNFATFLRNQSLLQGGKEGGVIGVKGEEQFSCTQLFEKELTPSDVGKLNRLVIPKKHAVTCFPLVCGNDVEVVFYDKLMRLWKFRYCYWKSSQSYVFTRGWNRFVKDKKLKAKDTIAFYRCEPINGGEGRPFSLIDVIYNDGGDRKIHSFEDDDKGGGDTKQILGVCNEVDDDQVTRGRIDLNEFHSTYSNNNNAHGHGHGHGHGGLRLFGVSIS